LKFHPFTGEIAFATYLAKINQANAYECSRAEVKCPNNSKVTHGFAKLLPLM
jgi:hypothetical protein